MTRHRVLPISNYGAVDIHTFVESSEQQQQQASVPSVPTFVASPFLMDLSEQPMMSAAQRRRQRRLRSWWRHEQQSIAAALAVSLHHSSRGQRKARARGGGERVALHGQGPEDSSSPAGALQPVRRRALRHTMEQIGDVAPVVPALGVPEPQMVDQPVAMIKPRRFCGARADYRSAQDLLAIPAFPRTVLREPQKAEQLVEVPVPAPSFQRLGPLGGDLQAHGSYVAWWLRMAPHRQPRAVYKYWARTSSTVLVPRSLSSSSSTEWWSSVVAAVATVTHSANCAVPRRL